ncbi:hypothetical protein [Ligilactobacillus cholophilus]|uniref:hypothetical protein n=1 Tax=Ligilactobacillus cholophilus TaxID=3050131 RepID=UPI0025AF5A85|nr:hypothetical protein [Ligilactobacillus cholophilus]
MSKKINLIRTLWYIVISAIFALVIPMVSELFTIDDVTQIGFIVFGFDMIFSVLVGLYAGKHKDSWILLLIFPVMFFITAKTFFISPLKFVAFIFLAASLLAYGIKR